ncbi:hypothetical protein OSB04_016906 [Centaurea solstitialis]|uniref:Uncharacterized protein n=1 Tax=Centaurea solstitialis TaxID=347529 RepID=A0AA38WLJ2_9ASTR|nr:hypothetical protein OSB04_016906 [Centaurea solstitialis]
MSDIIYTYIILHNMIIENEGISAINWSDDHVNPPIPVSQGSVQQFQQYPQMNVEIRDRSNRFSAALGAVPIYQACNWFRFLHARNRRFRFRFHEKRPGIRLCSPLGVTPKSGCRDSVSRRLDPQGGFSVKSLRGLMEEKRSRAGVNVEKPTRVFRIGKQELKFQLKFSESEIASSPNRRTLLFRIGKHCFPNRRTSL